MYDMYGIFTAFLDGGFKHFLFSPRKFGEDEPILTSIFFKWVGSTTNYRVGIFL